MNFAVEKVVPEGMTSAVTIPVGLPGVNTFSTPDWWSRVASVPGSGGVRQDRIDRPGAAVVLAPDDEPPREPSLVLMITRPLVDWLPGTVSDAAADPTDKLAEWADAVLAWAWLAPVHMVITRSDPEDLNDVCDAAAGRWAVIDSGDHDLSPGAEGFGAAVDRWLRDRRGWSADLDHFRARAAVDAVAMATVPPIGGYGDDLRRTSITVHERLSSAGVHILGPRTGLVWPPEPGPDLPLDVAAEASLAVILAGLDDPGATTGHEDLEAAAASCARKAQAARQELDGRRVDPRNLKRIPAGTLLKLMLLGHHRD